MSAPRRKNSLRLKLMPPPQWQAPQLRRGTVARWQLAPSNQPQTLEVQYRMDATAPGLRRVQLRCAPGCSSNGTSWIWYASKVAARPLLLGTVSAPAGAVLEVEAELEDASVSPGEVQWLAK